MPLPARHHVKFSRAPRGETFRFAVPQPLPIFRGVSADARQPISATTRLCAVYGHPIKHSGSPAMHNAALSQLGLNWRYLAFDVPPEKLREALSGARAMGFLGVNLTVPHKLLAVEMMDELDASARHWGAVNTVCFETRDTSGNWVPVAQVPADAVNDVRLHGFNTDADAIAHSINIDLAMEPRSSRVLLLGAGGAGRTAALRLAEEPVHSLWLVNRTEDKAAAIAAEIEERYPDVEVQVGYPDTPVDIVINATSLGLRAEDPLPLDTSRFPLHQADAVFDMIYRPAETPLLLAAHAAGCRVTNGIGMLVHQGAAALEIWSGKPAPVEVMREALIASVYGPTHA
jgi:shikimate dehydrogenase